MGGSSRSRRRFVVGFVLAVPGVAFGADPPEPVALAEFDGSVSSVSRPHEFVNVNGTLFFVGTDAARGQELWTSDGTPAPTGTRIVEDIRQGTAGSFPRELTDFGGVLFFTANPDGSASGRALWRSDGTEAGTYPVASNPPGYASWNPGQFVGFGGRLYFAARNGIAGGANELWRTDGTAVGTELVRSFPGGAVLLQRRAVVGGTLYFVADDGVSGTEVWKTDGTFATTEQVADLRAGAPGSNPQGLTDAGGELIFQANPGSTGADFLYRADPASGGTAVIPGTPSHIGIEFVHIGGDTYFAANDANSGGELYKYDGTTAARVASMLPTNQLPSELTVIDGTLFFQRTLIGGTFDPPQHQVWRSDGSPLGTVLVKDGFVDEPGGSPPLELTRVGGLLYFAARGVTPDGATAGVELWRSDGTPGGTELVRDIAPGPETSSPRDLTDVGGALYFQTSVGGTATLWRIGPPVASAPPLVTILSPSPDAIVGAATVDVTADVTHPATTTVTSVPAGVTASLPAGGGTASGSVPLAAEGPNTISVSATDAFGNVGGTSVEVIRDTTAPGVVVISPAAGAVVGMSPVDVTVEVADLTTTTLDVGGGAAALPAGGGSVTVTVALVAGPNDVSITVTDAAGNATTLTHTIVLDLEAPVVTIESPLDGQRFGPGSSPVAVTARVDDLSATSVSSVPAGVSDSLPAGGGIAVGAVGLVEGSNTITVSATDAAGQWSSDAVTVVYDTTAPSVAFAAPQDGDAVRGTIDVHVAADDPLPGSGVASVAVTIDGIPLATLSAAPFETTLDTTTLADGSHVLAATATDGLGNASATVSVTVLVDNTPPTVAIVLPADGSVASGLVPIEVSVADATSGLVAAGMTVSGVAPTTDGSTTYAAPVASDTLHGSESSTRWPDGPTPFAASARDAAGNVATATATVELDNTNPASNLVRPHDGEVVFGTISIEAAASDPNLASLTLLVDGVQAATSTTSPLVVPFDTTLRLDGPMTVELRVTDTAGNSSTSTAHVTVDNVGFTLSPTLLHLRTKGGAGAPADAELSGPNLALLLPTEAHAIELRIPGGNAVPAEQGWDGDDALSGPGLTRLRLRFSRAALVASVQAGIAGGHIDAASRQVVITLVADGRVQGTTVLAFVEGK